MTITYEATEKRHRNCLNNIENNFCALILSITLTIPFFIGFLYGLTQERSADRSAGYMCLLGALPIGLMGLQSLCCIISDYFLSRRLKQQLIILRLAGGPLPAE